MASTQSTAKSPMLVWRPIPDWPAYEVSNAGDVRRAVAAKTRRAGFNLKTSLTHAGYLQVSLCDKGHAKSVHVHRLVAAAFHGPAAGRCVHHKDHCKTHNHEGNLEYTTAQGNVTYMVVAGRQAQGDQVGYERRPRGTKHGMAKLTETAVQDIRRLVAAGVLSGQIAEQYGVSRDTIKLIRRGLSWKHVT